MTLISLDWLKEQFSKLDRHYSRVYNEMRLRKAEMVSKALSCSMGQSFEILLNLLDKVYPGLLTLLQGFITELTLTENEDELKVVYQVDKNKFSAIKQIIEESEKPDREGLLLILYDIAEDKVPMLNNVFKHANRAVKSKHTNPKDFSRFLSYIVLILMIIDLLMFMGSFIRWLGLVEVIPYIYEVIVGATIGLLSVLFIISFALIKLHISSWRLKRGINEIKKECKARIDLIELLLQT